MSERFPSKRVPGGPSKCAAFRVRRIPSRNVPPAALATMFASRDWNFAGEGVRLHLRKERILADDGVGAVESYSGVAELVSSALGVKAVMSCAGDAVACKLSSFPKGGTSEVSVRSLGRRGRTITYFCADAASQRAGYPFDGAILP